MGDTTSAPASGTDGPRGRLPRRRRGRVLIAVVLALLASSGWWWSHPHVLATNYGGTYGAEPRPVADAVTYVGLPDVGADTGGGSEVITLLDYEVVFSRNTAGADATLLLCTGSKEDSALGVGFAAQIDGACPTLREVHGPIEVRVGGDRWPPQEYLVLRVAPRRAGEVIVSDLALTYRRSASHLFQQGTQRLDYGSDSPFLRLTAT